MNDFSEGRTLSGVNQNTVRQLSLPSTRDAILVDGFAGEAGMILAKNDNTNKLEWDFAINATIPNGSIAGEKLKPDISINTTGTISSQTLTSASNLNAVNGVFSGDVNCVNLTATGDLNIDDIEADTIECNDIFMPQNVGATIQLSQANGNITAIQHTATSSFIQSGTTDNTFNGKIICPILRTLNQNTDAIEVYNGGKVRLYNDAGVTKTIDIDAQSGNITADFGLTTLHNTIIDNALIVEGNGIFCEDINISSNGNAPYTISLDGTSGSINAVSLLSTTSTITTGTFDMIYADNIEVPKAGVPQVLISSNGQIICQSLDAGSGNITGGNCTFGSVGITGGLAVGTDASIGGILTQNGAGNNAFTGSITTASLGTTSGSISSADNISATNDITAGGKIESNNAGVNPPPTGAGGGYTDYALNLSQNTSHAYIGGNVILGGTLYGNVEGTITEEHIDAESLRLRPNVPAGSPQGLDIERLDLNIYDGDPSLAPTVNLFSVDGSTGICRVSCIQQTHIPVGGRLSNTFNFSTVFNTNSGSFVTFNTDFNVGATFKGTFRENNNVKRIEIDSASLRMLQTNGFDNLHITSDGNIEYKAVSKKLAGFSTNTPAPVNYTQNYTTAENLNLGNNTNNIIDPNYLSVNYPTTKLQRLIQTNSTNWIDVNDKLHITIQSNHETKTQFIVRWDFYAVITAGAVLFAKLYDRTAKSPNNADQPTFLNNTTMRINGEANGQSDTAKHHSPQFIIGGSSPYPATTSKNIGVAIWTIASAGHLVNFRIGDQDTKDANPTSATTDYGGMVLEGRRLPTDMVDETTPSNYTVVLLAGSEEDY